MYHSKDIIKQLPGRIYWKNRQGVYMGCNNNTLKALGIRNINDFIGKTPFDLYAKDIARKITEIDEEIMRTGMPKISEETMPVADGSLRTYLSHKIPFTDEQNEVQGIMCILFDITERKKYELELQASKEMVDKDLAKTNVYLKNILAHMPGNIYWRNLEGIYIGTNEMNARLIGRTVEDYVGKTAYELYRTEVADYFEKIDQEVICTGNPVFMEEKAPRLDGSQGVYFTQKVPLRDENKKVIGVLGMSIDITERKLAESILQEAKERAESANRAKTEFLATVSHELRTPLTGIIGMVRALARVDIPPTARDFVNDVRKSAEHLLSLINDLLDITKLEAGKMELYPTPINFKRLVQQTVNMLVYQAQLKGLEVVTEYDINVPAFIIADGRALRQIILNLLGNAIKFTEKGKVTVKVLALELFADTVVFEVSVQDTGIGIPTEKLAKIFERFVQADSSYSRRYGGTGLGLSLCKNYVELMGGEISVSSAMHQGSKFICKIPFKLQQEMTDYLSWESFPEPVEENFVENKSSTFLSALLVEDNPVVQKVHQMILNEFGYRVEVARGGHIALDILMSGKKFDVVFMDVGLPDISGLEVTKMMREYEAKHQLEPCTIVAMTAYAHEEDHKNCLAAGMNAVVTKPIDVHNLKQVLLSVVPCNSENI